MLTYSFMKFCIANAVEIVPAFELEGLSSGAMQSKPLFQAAVLRTLSWKSGPT